MVEDAGLFEILESGLVAEPLEAFPIPTILEIVDMLEKGPKELELLLEIMPVALMLLVKFVHVEVDVGLI